MVKMDFGGAKVTGDNINADATLEEQKRYEKRGSAGSLGIDFQMGLLILTMLNAFKSLQNWRLSVENIKAGKFDDVVLEWPGGALLLQAKQKEDKKMKISLGELTSPNTNKNNPFSLPKYFASYIEDIRKKFKVENIIICTNVGVDQDVLKYLKPLDDCSKSILCYPGGSCSFYTFDDKLSDSLKPNISRFYDNTNRSDKEDITNGNIKEFFKKLQFFFKYPSGEHMKDIVNQLLLNVKYSETPQGPVLYTEIYEKLKLWFHQKRGVYFTQIRAKAMFFEISRDKYFQSLRKYKITFLNKALNFNCPKGIFHVVTTNNQLSQELRLYEELKCSENNVLCLYPDSDPQIQRETVEAFDLPNYSYLIIICTEISERHTAEKIRDIVDKSTDKKVVLLANAENELNKNIACENIEFPVTFQHISMESQDDLLKKVIITFQGRDVSLMDLFGNEAIKHAKTFSSELLDGFIKGTKISIGLETVPSEEHISPYYVSRKLISGFGILPEENIFGMLDRVVLIYDSPGSGKTTLLKKLELLIKQNHPDIWVIRMELKEYTKEFDDLINQSVSSLEAVELLQLKQKFNDLEKLVLSSERRVVLMLDGLSDVGWNCTQIILNSLSQWQESSNFAKIYLTTSSTGPKTNKPNVLQDMKFLTFQSFSQKNQLEFLVKFWSHNLEIDGGNIKKCEKYASKLLGKIKFLLTSYFETNNSAAVPSQVKILAENFQENKQFDELKNWQGCREFINSGDAEPKIPNMQLTELLSILVEKKREMYIAQANPTANPIAGKALDKMFDEYLHHHTNLALKEVFGVNTKQFTTYQRCNKVDHGELLPMGFLSQDRYSIRFVDNIFAHYFAAKTLIKELQHPNLSQSFYDFFISQLLRNSSSFLAIIDNILDSSKFCLSTDAYKKFTVDIDEHRLCVLVKSGYGAILNFLFNHEVVQNCLRGMLKESQNILFDAASTGNLKTVKLLVDNGADVNCSDSFNNVPLHFGVRCKDVAQFLIDNGAVINKIDMRRESPLHMAVDWGRLSVVELLVNRGADFKQENIYGRTGLHIAVCKEHSKIVSYFLEAILEIDGMNSGNYLAAYAAAYLGRLDILREQKGMDPNKSIGRKYLIMAATRGMQLDVMKYLKEHGADVNVTDEKGNTSLHIACRNRSSNGSYERTVELLLKFGANAHVKNNDNKTALSLALSVHNYDIAQTLLDCGVDINHQYENLRTILHEFTNDVNTTKYLVRNKVKVDIQDVNGDTALHLAVKSNFPSVLEYLLRVAKADANKQDNDGCTALHMAVRYYQGYLVQLLVQNDADVNIQDKNGRAPLHLAVSSHDLKSMKWIVQEGGANLNIADNEGVTVLRLASDEGILEELKKCTIEKLRLAKSK